MELLEQCQIWNANDEYQKIVDAIEALPAETRTPELDSELARAYNNVAQVGDTELFEKAIALLKPHEAYFQGDHCWNFRMGYAYYYLDQEGPALRYFRQALEARPGDEDTQELIDDCQRRLALPRFEKNFCQRVAQSWEAFLQGEAQLRQLLDQRNQEAVAQELIDRCSALLRPAFADISFELGFNGEKYELILSPEGDRSKLFALVYFWQHAPAEILQRWNILVGRQRSHGFGLRSFGLDISEQEVQVWVEKTGDKPQESELSLTLYCEKLLPLLREEEGKAWWMLSTLTDQVLGEIPAMALLDGFEVVDAPREEPGISLEELPERLEEMGFVLDADPQRFLENHYTAYESKPDEDPDADWRLDVFAGSTRCPALVNEYLRGESDCMDAFHRDGAVPGFFCYPLESFAGQADRGKAVLDFRDALQEAVQQQAGEDAVVFLGGASGLYCGYLDFIAWDLPAVLHAAADYFANSPLEWANFHTFRREVSTVRLVNRDAPAQEDDAHAPSVKAQEDEEETGSFVGFALLAEPGWDKAQLLRDLQADWEIQAEETQDDDASLVFSLGDLMVAVSLMPAPIPNGEAQENAENNYLWPGAVDAAKAHKAHLLVAVLGQEADLLERGKLFVKVMASCCKQPQVTGIYTSGTVFEPRFYEGFAGMLREGELPIFNWIWFGLYRREGGVCGYTYGMRVFGKDEMEVLDADAQPSQVRDFLASLVSYVLEGDVTLQDGETIGFSAEDKHPITRGEGVSLPGVTLKIGYAAAEE